MGGSNLDQIPRNPTEPEIVSGGIEIPNSHTSSCSDHCGGHCNCCDDYWHYNLKMDVPTAACGGNGGSGGDGGNGGAAGLLSLSGAIENSLTANNMQLDSSGGAAGEDK